MSTPSRPLAQARLAHSAAAQQPHPAQARYVLPSFVERTSYGIKEMNPYNKLFEERIIFLGVQIDDASANDVIAQLIALESMDPDRDITMYINSPGGSVTSMMAIYDTMQFVQPEIATVCIGQAASAAAVLLAAWCGLRRGEVLGLLPQDVDLDAGTITVRRNRIELLETRQAFDADPKTDAGRRTVSIPPHVLPFLIEHMTTWAGTDRVFIGRDGRPMRGDAIRQAFTRARHTADMPGFRFHDLRHTGQTLAASTGATTKDLMLRLGHASPAAANRYLHTVDGRDAEIASALSDLAAHGNAARLPKAIVIKS